MELQKSEVDSSVSRKENGSNRSRREIVRDDISKRLRHVCAHLKEEEFKKLVDTMVDQKLKGERSRAL